MVRFGARADPRVGLPGIEPGTSALSVLRSNQLSYSPEPGSQKLPVVGVYVDLDAALELDDQVVERRAERVGASAQPDEHAAADDDGDRLGDDREVERVE